MREEISNYTFMRSDSLVNCLKSIQQNQGQQKRNKELYYVKFISENITTAGCNNLCFKYDVARTSVEATGRCNCTSWL